MKSRLLLALACIGLAGCTASVQPDAEPRPDGAKITSTANDTPPRAESQVSEDTDDEEPGNKVDPDIPNDGVAAFADAKTPIWLRVPKDGKVFAVAVPGSL